MRLNHDSGKYKIKSQNPVGPTIDFTYFIFISLLVDVFIYFHFHYLFMCVRLPYPINPPAFFLNPVAQSECRSASRGQTASII